MVNGIDAYGSEVGESFSNSSIHFFQHRSLSWSTRDILELFSIIVPSQGLLEHF